MHPQSSPESLIVAPSGAVELAREQIDLLKRTIARGTTDDEFRLFLEACKRRRFDPFSKLIYPVKRWDSATRTEVMALQSSIDSFRLIAERTGRYAGQVGPFWCGKDGVWKDVWLDDAPPAAARVGVLRPDFKEPLYAVALWNAYAQKKKDGTLTQFWSKMGPLMLGKCAEALALRRAFPEDLAGLVTADEMEQAGPQREPEELPGVAAPQLPPSNPIPDPAFAAQRHAERIARGEDPDKFTGQAATDQVVAEMQGASAAKVAKTVAKAQKMAIQTWEWQPRTFIETAIPVNLGTWASWRDKELPEKGALRKACASKGPTTWRTAAQGNKSGGRHNLLLAAVTSFQKSKPEGDAPLDYQRAACALAILLAGIESVPDEHPDTTEADLFQEPEPAQ
jgi:phage recombination protein Bet